MPLSAIARRTRVQAQALRRRPTDAERKLWYVLRSLKPLGMHFRRQASIGAYIADFGWHDGKLVIELDGSQHVDLRRAYDERRTASLQSQGYRVLRFWNNDVLKMPRSVAEAILVAARASESGFKNPTPGPPHKGEGSTSVQAARTVFHDR